jgi:hypothetical protein
VDAFEQLVSEILWMSGFWVRTSVKVELTKEEKRLIGRHSSPRWELDIVGYSARKNVLQVVECKSYMDSTDRKAIRAQFEAQGWDLWDEPWLRDHLKRMAEQGYENQVSAVVAKLLLRGKVD